MEIQRKADLLFTFQRKDYFRFLLVKDPLLQCLFIRNDIREHFLIVCKFPNELKDQSHILALCITKFHTHFFRSSASIT